jgi:hypothetical protein
VDPMSNLWWTILVVCVCAVLYALMEGAFSLVRRLQRKRWDHSATHGCLVCEARAPIEEPLDHDEWCPRWRVPR